MQLQLRIAADLVTEVIGAARPNGQHHLVSERAQLDLLAVVDAVAEHSDAVLDQGRLL